MFIKSTVILTPMDNEEYKKLCCRKEAARASIQNVERSLLLLVVSASDIPLRTIKCSLLNVLCSRRIGPCAGRHKQTFDGASPIVRSTLHGRR